MLFGVFGAPSPLSYWTVMALRTTVDVVYSRHRYVETHSLADLRQAVAERGDDPVVYFSDCPEAEVVQGFLDSGAPYIVCLEHPTEVMGYCIRARQMRPLDAFRFSVQSVSAMHPLAFGAKARILRRGGDLSASQTILEFCSAFSLTADTALAAEAVRQIAKQSDLQDALVEDLIQAAIPDSLPLGAYRAALGDMGTPAWMVETVEPYASVFAGRRIDEAFWPREAFLDPRGVNEEVAEEQDLTGPSRHLVFGPFLHLPPGRWRATAAIQVNDVRANALMVDVAILGVPAQIGRFDLPDRGKFEFSLDFDVKEPRGFLEVRIVMLIGAIEGRFRFGGVKLHRIDPP